MNVFFFSNYKTFRQSIRFQDIRQFLFSVALADLPVGFPYRFNSSSLYIYLGEGKGGGCTNACICIGTHNQPFLQNHSMDVYET